MLDSLLATTSHDTSSLNQLRSRGLAMMVLSFAVITTVGALAAIVSGDSLQAISTIASIPIVFIVIYIINRQGYLRIATGLFLSWLAIMPLLFVVLILTPIPSIFFFTIVVVAAAAFTQPLTPFLWAAALTPVIFLINLFLYGSLLPPVGPLALPNGTLLPPILVLEVNALVLLWIIAGGTSIATRMLQQALFTSQQATQSMQQAQETLVQQQHDLKRRNEELAQAREDLMSLVNELAVPVVPISDGIGMLPLIGTLTPERMQQIEQRTLATVAERRMRALVIDLSGAHGVEHDQSFAILRLCAGLRLIGTETILTGIKARDAMVLSSIELHLPHTAASLQDALARLR